MLSVHTVDAGEARLADLAPLDERNGRMLNRRVPAPWAGDDQQFSVAVAGRDHLIHLGGRGRYRLLDVDVRVGLCCRHRKPVVVADLARGDDRDVRALLGKHLPVVGVSFACTGPLQCLLASAVVRVGQRHDRGAFDVDKGLVEIVSVTAAARMSNDRYSVGHADSSDVKVAGLGAKVRSRTAGILPRCRCASQR